MAIYTTTGFLFFFLILTGCAEQDNDKVETTSQIAPNNSNHENPIVPSKLATLIGQLLSPDNQPLANTTVALKGRTILSEKFVRSSVADIRSITNDQGDFRIQFPLSADEVNRNLEVTFLVIDSDNNELGNFTLTFDTRQNSILPAAEADMATMATDSPTETQPFKLNNASLSVDESLNIKDDLLCSGDFFSLNGLWLDERNTEKDVELTITNYRWGTLFISKLCPDQGYAILKGDLDLIISHNSNYEHKDKYHAVIWRQGVEKTWQYCLTGENLDDELAAQKSTQSCSGSWIQLQPILAISGSWLDSYGSQYIISSFSWSESYAGMDPIVKKVILFDNQLRMAILQDPKDAPFNAEKYSRITWLTNADGSIYLCTENYGMENQLEAANDLFQADSNNPGNSGCGNFPWSRLSPN